jgi:hypothetical protein
MENTYPDKARGWVGFNVPMSHKITAACDILLMPSRFEPCGLNQLYAMAYGTVPVAHSTGGLRDTVIPFNPWDGAPPSPLLQPSHACITALISVLPCSPHPMLLTVGVISYRISPRWLGDVSFIRLMPPPCQLHAFRMQPASAFRCAAQAPAQGGLSRPARWRPL